MFNSLKILAIVQESDWYTIPVNEQKLLILLIQRGQRVFSLKSSGGLECSRKLFFKVRTMSQAQFSITIILLTHFFHFLRSYSECLSHFAIMY